MRLILALLIIIYLVGVGVVLSPVVEVDLGQRNRVGLLRQHRSGVAGRIGVAGEARAREREAVTQSVGIHGARSDWPGDAQLAVARSSAAATHLFKLAPARLAAAATARCNAGSTRTTNWPE